MSPLEEHSTGGCHDAYAQLIHHQLKSTYPEQPGLTYTKTIPKRIVWRLRLEKDITAYQSAEISATDDESHADGAFPGGREVVADPAAKTDEGGVDADGDEEEEEVG
jgi:hypothetical protein